MTIICFGDSLTQRGFEAGGWVSLLANAYIRRHDVFNRGYSGYNSEWCLHVMPYIIKEFKQVELFIIFLGANDAVLPGERQHVTLDRYVENLKHLVEQAKTISIRVLVISPPPVLAQDWENHRKSQGRQCDRTEEHTLEYAKKCLSFAHDSNIPVVDLLEAFDTYLKHNLNVDMRSLFCDGLHFAPTGHKIVFDAVFKAITGIFPDFHPDKCEIKFPWHDKVNVSCLNNSIKP